MIGSVASLGLRSRLSAADPGIDPAPLSGPDRLGIDPADLRHLGVTSRDRPAFLWTYPCPASDFSAVWIGSDSVLFHF
jgi:hypothetical protein